MARNRDLGLLELWSKILKYYINDSGEVDRAVCYTNTELDTSPLSGNQYVENVSVKVIEIDENRFWKYTIRRTEEGRTEEQNRQDMFKYTVETFLQPELYKGSLVICDSDSDSDSDSD